MSIDPPGTCHLVGCPDKGKHPPHGGLLAEFAQTLDRVTANMKLAANLMPPRTGKSPRTAAPPELHDAYGWRFGVRPKIGVPDDATPYQRPMIDHCLGYPKLEFAAVGAVAFCSIVASCWSIRFETGTILNLAALVDQHKADCINREVVP